MSTSVLPHPAELAGDRGGTDIDRVAAETTTTELGADHLLVIALRPDTDDRRVVATSGYSSIRAAISVAVAAGNTRAWSPVADGGIAAIAVSTLPEIIRSSVEPSGLHSIQVGAVRCGDQVVCMTMWLSSAPSDHIAVQHNDVLNRLAAAAGRDLTAANAAAAARAAATGDRDGGGFSRPSNGEILAALPNREQFHLTLESLQVDEAAVVVFGIDGADTMSADARQAAREVVAESLASALRKCDVIGYVADDTFAVLLANVDRRNAFEIARRLRGGLADGPSISVGLSHEDGLIDPVEMFASAMSAMLDARLEGGSRMLIAC